MEIQYDVDEEIKKIDDKINDAEENLGDQEVRDAVIEKADFYKKAGMKEKAIETYQLAYQKTVGIGLKMDVIFNILNIQLADQNLDKIKEQIDHCKKLFEEGGDWERKNRLKVYEAIYFLMVREFKSASKLFLDSISTFNSPEIITYNDLVFYTVLTSIISLGRVELKEKVVHSPEILSIIREIPNLKPFLDSFYKCDQHNFYIAFAHILGQIEKDRYLHEHKRYFTREMRVVVYSQFLEAYKTVTLQSMAQAFGVSVEFIDKELSDLISSRRLVCKIDKVAGIVESQRIDERSNLYKQALKRGDFLLNRVQKLSRVIDV